MLSIRYINPRAELVTVTIRTKSEMMRKSFSVFLFYFLYSYFIRYYICFLLFRNPFGKMNSERRKKLRHSRASGTNKCRVGWIKGGLWVDWSI